MARKITDSTNENQTPNLSPDALAFLERIRAASAQASALTPKKRQSGPAKIRTYFDTEAILNAAKGLSSDSDWLDLTTALGFDDDDTLNGPKLRTRLSQLINAKRLPENFRPLAPAGKPLYLARKAESALIAEALALGIPAEMIPGTPENLAAEKETRDAALAQGMSDYEPTLSDEQEGSN